MWESLPDTAFNIDRIQSLQPETWKNVGVSLIQAVRQLRDQAVETSETMATVKSFMDTFFMFVLEFTKNNEQEMVFFKKQIDKDVKNFSTKI